MKEFPTVRETLTNINTPAATFAWEWFAQQRFKTDQYLLAERANKIRGEVRDKIRFDFRVHDAHMRHRFDLLTNYPGRDER
jgi:hypothetical protein